MSTFLTILKVALPLILQGIGLLLTAMAKGNAATATADTPLGDSLTHIWGQGAAGIAAFLGGSIWHAFNFKTALHAIPPAPPPAAGADPVDDVGHLLSLAAQSLFARGEFDAADMLNDLGRQRVGATTTQGAKK